jgi:hypothetical protein
VNAPPLVRSAVAALALAAALPAPAQGKPTAGRSASSEESDGERAMGGWALVVFNTRPFEFPNTGGAPPIPLTVYTVGLRHWTTGSWGRFPNWGLDLGVGLAYGRSSVTQPQTGRLVTSDGPSTSGFGFHAGLPLAVRHHRHATFELVPEMDLIWASESLPPQTPGGDATEYRGWSLRAGARAGFEIFFGFVGLPQLAVEASLGAAVTYDKISSKVGPIERSVRQWGVATLRGSEPWSIFTGNVAAMYHF